MRLERGLIVLEVVTGIAPLIGLIGTVSGLVHVFSGLGLSTGASDTKAVALGISEALNCTIFGLSIAVPALIAFSYFSKKVEVMSVEMESLVSDLIAKCYYGRVPSGEAASLRGRPRRRPPGHPSRKRGRCFVAMKIAVRKRRAPSIIIVSLVDILTILLIFFVVSTTFKRDQPEVQINLPDSRPRTRHHPSRSTRS